MWHRDAVDFGIDIGGSGVKGAPVDLKAGAFAKERLRLDTPQPASPEAVAATVAELTKHFKVTGRIGVTLPSVIKDGVACTAANLDPAWIGTDAAAALSEATGCDAVVLNDADAAGLAEAKYGGAKGYSGVVVMVTLGTGIGSAVLHNGVLLPNSELGHLEIKGHDAETKASDAAREREDLSWDKWAHRVSRYLRHLEALLWPDLIVVGGGVSKKSDKWIPLLEEVRTKVVPATLHNDAGIIGAALHAKNTKR